MNNDILIITSKVVSLENKLLIKLDGIIPTQRAIELAEKADMDPKVVQIIMDEPNTEVVGHVKNALLTINAFGMIPNSGVDQSNSPKGAVILLPRKPEEFATKIVNRIKDDFGVSVGVIIMDSTVNPLRQGTSGIALAVAGFEPVISDIGKTDLFGRLMVMTTRAIGDNIATAANIVMGESNEQTPFAIVRGLDFNFNDLGKKVDLIPQEYCLFFGPFSELRRMRQ